MKTRTVKILSIGLVLVLLAWIGGELHKQSCVEQHKIGCSVLPWVSGRQPNGWGQVGFDFSHAGAYLFPTTHYLMP